LVPRLKVFCTTSGFYDSVVAAPSKPAALKAWGAKTDLFSMGAAGLVTDPDIVKKALARPGEVIRLKRSGSREEVAQPAKKKPSKTKRPSRAKLETAERRLATLTKKQAAEEEKINADLRALEKKRDELLARHAKARAAAEIKVEKAREDYQSALDQWEA
jgi:hypothetical protein